MKKIFYFLFAISILFGACKKNIDDSIITDKEDPSNTTTETTLALQVRDVQNKPIEGVKVTIGTQTFISDAQGNVSIKNIVVNNEGTGIMGEKVGYFPGFQRVFKQDDKAALIMSPTANCEEFENSVGKEINKGKSLTHNFSIPSDAFENTDGSAYSGKVKFCYLRIANTDTLNGLVTKNFNLSLSTGKPYQTDLGYLMVKASTPLDVPLRLKTNKIIKYSIPLLLIPFGDFFPDTAPALFLDTENGNVWKQSGIAKKKNLNYDFDINKVNTMWSVDAAVRTFLVEGTLVDKDNAPMSVGYLLFKNTTKNTQSYAHLGKDGKFSTFVEANENLTMGYENCSEEKSTLKSVTFTTNTKLGTVIADKISIIKGKVVDCNGNPLTSGEVQIGDPNKVASYTELKSDGTFKYYPSCDEEKKNTIKVQAFANGKISQLLDFQIKKGEINDVGTVTLCNNPTTNYGVIEVGADKYYFSQEFSLKANNAFPQFFSMSQSVAKSGGSGSNQITWIPFSMDINLNTPLNTATTIPYISLSTIPVSSNLVVNTIINCNYCLSYTLTKFVPDTEIEGTLSGTYNGKVVKGSFYFKK